MTEDPVLVACGATHHIVGIFDFLIVQFSKEPKICGKIISKVVLYSPDRR